MADTFEIVVFNPDDKEQMDLICAIHSDVLPDSFVEMGKYFHEAILLQMLAKNRFFKVFFSKV